MAFLMPSASIVQAQGTPPPESAAPETTASYTFGQALDFTLSVINTPTLANATLHVTTPQFATTYLVDFPITADPGATIQLQHTINLTEVYIQPFTTITYWWTLVDSDNISYVLPLQDIAYDDDTFAWKSQSEAGIDMYWIADGQDLGQVGMDVVTESLPRILSLIPADMSGGIRIYLYPSAEEFQAALRLTRQDWAGGHASPKLGVIMLPAENPRTAVVDLRRSIPHELSHLVLYRATADNYDNVPRWFDEGLATLFETVPNPNYAITLESLLANNELIPFNQLCTQFPSDSSDAALRAYAQSNSLMQYIQDTYGNTKIQEMITALADGANCETVTTRVLGRTVEQLTADWLGTVQPDNGFNFDTSYLWIIIIVAGFILTGLLLFRS